MAGPRTADRERPLRPSDTLAMLGITDGRTAVAAARDGGWLALIAALAVWYFVLPDPRTAYALVIAAVITGVVVTVGVARQRLHAPIPAPAVALLTAAALNAAWLPLQYGQPRLAAFCSLAAWEGLARLPRPRKGEVPWWSHDSLQTAFVVADICKISKDADGNEVWPTLRFPGRRKVVPGVGTFVHVALPAGKTHHDVRSHHAQLAAALEIPEDSLDVSHDRGMAANVVTIGYLLPRDTTPVEAEIPERTDFTKPIQLGVSHLGTAVMFVTLGVHTMIVALTRSGKSWLLRSIAKHAFLDPRTAVLIFSFKDPKEDWRPARDLVAPTPDGVRGYIGVITDEDDVDAALALLRFIRKVCAYRNNISEDQRFPLFVVIDEWMFGVETARGINAKKAQQMEKEIVMLAAVAAGVNVHLATTFQRSTVDFLKSSLKANLGQRLVGLTKGDGEIRNALDCVPTGRRPELKGEFWLTTNDSDPLLFRAEKLDDRTWAEQVIPAAMRLRDAHPHPPLLPELAEPIRLEDDAYPDVPVEQDDPQTLAVWELLADGPLTATQLQDALTPRGLQAANSAWLGRALRQMEGVVQITEGSGSTATRKWKLVPHPHGAPSSPRWLQATGQLLPPDEQPVGATGTDGRVLSVVRDVP